ncbi:efflux RND transporter periplasmic adaptor subunit [Erwinia papayae]|uniref:Efflux RND transporter periplasmic adaptor subunit n=1 Tax=Erwinia papayae TaxID=206499 RepID=A0ABV3MVP2_9GAMM
MVFNKIALVGLTLLMVGCDQKADNNATERVTEVGVVTLKSAPVELFSNLNGRVTGTMVSDVRPQVDGIIKQRLFTEGSEVKQGQVLYQIDPASYQASYDQAVAQLNNAIAVVKSSKLKAQRYKALLSEEGVSRQDADDAEATWQQNLASVAQYRAAVESARINLDWTKIKAPISGRIGISSVTPGALVSSGQSDALATIRALDPIYVDLTQSSSQLLKLKKQQAGRADSDSVPVTVTLDDGSRYPQTGKLELTEVAVDESTGMVTLRAIFPNPDRDLLPGMYVRAAVSNGVKQDAILAPQQGISRDAKGNATALVVDKENKVVSREVVTSQVLGNQWLVSSGLAAGDRLITEGTGKVQAGMTVKATEVSDSKTAADAQPASGGQ